jgi:tetratricopeptide (TPR) repeat protein
MISLGNGPEWPVDLGREVWEQLFRSDPSSPALLIPARHYLAQAQYEQALDIAQRVRSAHPDRLDAAVLVGRALLELSRQNEAAGMLEPWIAELDSLAGLLGELAQLLRALGLNEPALRADRASAALAGAEEAENEPKTDREGHDDPPDIVPTETLAFLYLNQGHRDKAVEVYRQLLSQDPGNDRLKVKLAELAVEEAAELLTTPDWNPAEAVAEFRPTGDLPLRESRPNGHSHDSSDIPPGKGDEENRQRLSRRLEKLKTAARKRRAQVEAEAL